MSRLLALVALVSLVLPVTISAGCTQTVAEGTDKYELFLLEETAPVTFEIEWKHNSQLVFKRKSKKINPGKPEDITEQGALVLRQLAAKHVGTYVGEVWGNEGESVKKQEIDLCVKARVPKPSVTFDCPTKDTVTISCNLKQSDVTFTWTKNKVVMKGEKTSTLVMKIKDLKRDDTFSCTVDDTYSNETSDSVKSTCEGIQARVPKPTVTFDCATKDTVTISCNLKQSDVTFTWTKNKVIMKGEKTSTLVMKIKDLKRDDTFSCTVDDTYSNETSDSVKSTCEGIQGGSEVAAGTLLGFPFWVTVSVLAGGGGFVLLLIVITVVCCYRNHCKSHEDEAEFRLAPSSAGH
ncbi:uncharacterized protein LOC134007927 [Osmerus eperlanus]|uniref:uncharacterized protein LOC134007927 n=1 Tax=Osmerus eperlanus TaxID=29151 RepID=UPI002E0F5F45